MEDKTISQEVDLPFKMRALANFIRKLVCNGAPDDTAAIQAQACEDAADEIERLRKSVESRCENCLDGKHDCKEEGGGRGWIEFECQCTECPSG